MSWNIGWNISIIRIIIGPINIWWRNNSFRLLTLTIVITINRDNWSWIFVFWNIFRRTSLICSEIIFNIIFLYITWSLNILLSYILILLFFIIYNRLIYLFISIIIIIIRWFNLNWSLSFSYIIIIYIRIYICICIFIISILNISINGLWFFLWLTIYICI